MNFKIVFFLTSFNCGLWIVGTYAETSAEYWSKEFQSGPVVGGRNATRVYPFMVSLQGRKRGTHFCSGAILDEKYIISAAHCFDGRKAKNVYALVGSTSIFGGEVHRVKRIIRHPKYEKDSTHDNIAIVEVRKKFKFAKAPVKPIKLGHSTVRENDRLMTLGWGRKPVKPFARLKKLQIFYTKALSSLPCLQWVPEMTSEKICLPGEKISCLSDAGGPLIGRGRENKLELVGINSNKVYSCSAKLPISYLRIDKYVDFLYDEIGII